MVAQTVKCLYTTWETWVRSLGWEVLWRRKWQPTPVLLPRKSHGGRSLVGYSPWGCRVRHDWVTSLSFSFYILWKWFTDVHVFLCFSSPTQNVRKHVVLRNSLALGRNLCDFGQVFSIFICKTMGGIRVFRYHFETCEEFLVHGGG